MYSNKQDREHHTHQETQSRDESHTCETIIMFIFIYFILFCFMGQQAGTFFCCFGLHWFFFWEYSARGEGRVPGLSIRNCADISYNLVTRGSKVRAIDVCVDLFCFVLLT